MTQQEFEAAHAKLKAWEIAMDARIEEARASDDGKREYTTLLIRYANARARKAHALGI